MVECILTPDNLNRSYSQVKANKVSGGIDRMGVEQLLSYLREHKDEITESLLGVPSESRKEGRDIQRWMQEHALGIPTIVDRFIQQSITQVLSLMYEPKFTTSDRNGARIKHCKRRSKSSTTAIHTA